MNLEFLKSKNSKIILGVLALVVVIIIVIVMISGGSRNNDKLLLTCIGENEIENILDASQTITLYKTDNGIKLLLENKMSINEEYSNYSQSVYDSVRRDMEHQYEYLNRVDYINYDANYNDEYLFFNIEYNITSESNEQMISEYNYDFLNSSIDETKIYFEGEGYKCQNS